MTMENAVSQVVDIDSPDIRTQIVSLVPMLTAFISDPRNAPSVNEIQTLKQNPLYESIPQLAAWFWVLDRPEIYKTAQIQAGGIDTNAKRTNMEESGLITACIEAGQLEDWLCENKLLAARVTPPVHRSATYGDIGVTADKPVFALPQNYDLRPQEILNYELNGKAQAIQIIGVEGNIVVLQEGEIINQYQLEHNEDGLITGLSGVNPDLKSFATPGLKIIFTERNNPLENQRRRALYDRIVSAKTGLPGCGETGTESKVVKMPNGAVTYTLNYFLGSLSQIKIEKAVDKRQIIYNLGDGFCTESLMIPPENAEGRIHTTSRNIAMEEEAKFLEFLAKQTR
jgi:hypothetical protein